MKIDENHQKNLFFGSFWSNYKFALAVWADVFHLLGTGFAKSAFVTANVRNRLKFETFAAFFARIFHF